jgi:hypothetical protein
VFLLAIVFGIGVFVLQLHSCYFCVSRENMLFEIITGPLGFSSEVSLGGPFFWLGLLEVSHQHQLWLSFFGH